MDNEFYEIDTKALLGRSTVEDISYLNEIKQRKLFLNDEIDIGTVEDIIKNILQYNKDDKGIDVKDRKPILLYIMSNGGEVDSGYALIDAIQMSKTPVYTINLGYWYSMGFLIGIAGHKRFATKNAKILIHDGTNMLYSSGMKVQDRMEFQRKIDERMRDYIVSRGKITADEYDRNQRVEWYMFADEAKEKGFIDYIIGEDCDVDEII